MIKRLISELMNSNEYLQMNPDAATTVISLFEALYGRLPSAHELQSWSTLLSTEQITIDDLINDLMIVTEFQQYYQQHFPTSLDSFIHQSLPPKTKIRYWLDFP